MSRLLQLGGAAGPTEDGYDIRTLQALLGRRNVSRLIETEDKAAREAENPDDGYVVPRTSAPSLDLLGTIYLLFGGGGDQWIKRLTSSRC